MLQWCLVATKVQRLCQRRGAGQPAFVAVGRAHPLARLSAYSTFQPKFLPILLKNLFDSIVRLQFLLHPIGQSGCAVPFLPFLPEA